MRRAGPRARGAARARAVACPSRARAAVRRLHPGARRGAASLPRRAARRPGRRRARRVPRATRGSGSASSPASRRLDSVASSGKGTGGELGALREGAIGLPGVLLQSTTHLAPAVTLLLSLQFLVLFAGAAVPLALVLSFGIALMLALSAAELAKRFPSAGGYYAYTSRSLGPRAGFLTAWMYALYSPILPGFMLAYLGSVLDASLRAEYGVHVPWWVWLVGGACLTALVAYRGIQLSVGTLVVLGLLEVAIVVALAVSSLVDPGHGGVTAQPFRPSTAP